MAIDPWIANASPLILLEKADMVGLLVTVAGDVLVPQAVWDEIEAGPDGGRSGRVRRRPM